MLPDVSPGLLGHVVSPEVPSKVLYRALLLLEATEPPTQVEQRLSFTAGRMSSLGGEWGASLLQALHVDKPQQAEDTATAELCRFKGKMVRTKSNISNKSLYLMVRRPKSPASKRKFLCLAKFYGLFGIFTESVFQLPTKRCASLLYRRPFPVRMYKNISLPGIFSLGLSRRMETMILNATLPHQLRDGVR